MSKKNYNCKNKSCGVVLELELEQLTKSNYILQCPTCKIRQKVKPEDLMEIKQNHPPGWLMIHDEQTKNEVYTLLVGDNVFGRKPGSDKGCHRIESKDTFLSRRHCGIQVRPTSNNRYHYLLQDLGSTNGTYLNAENRKYNPKDIIYLRDNDLIQMGRTKFIFIEYHPGRTAQSVFDELAQTSFRKTIIH